MVVESKAEIAAKNHSSRQGKKTTANRDMTLGEPLYFYLWPVLGSKYFHQFLTTGGTEGFPAVDYQRLHKEALPI